jgi:ribosomal protein L31
MKKGIHPDYFETTVTRVREHLHHTVHKEGHPC